MRTIRWCACRTDWRSGGSGGGEIAAMQEAGKKTTPTAALPRLAVWLLESFGSPRYRDSLLGDLIEQRRAGRSGLWCWKQVAYALCLARLSTLRCVRWMAAIRALLLALGIVVLGAGTLAWAESVHNDGLQRVGLGDAAPGR